MRNRFSQNIFYLAGLAVYSVVLFLTMTFYRLPADKVIGATLDNLTHGRLFLEAQKIAPKFLGGYKMEDISYGILLRDTIAKDSLKSLTIRPDYQRLLIGYFPVKIEGIMPRGEFYGKTGFSIRNGLKNTYFNIKLDDMYLEDIKVLRASSGRDIRGKLDGELKINGDFTDPSNIDGEGHFFVEKGSTGTRLNLPGLESVSFNNIKLAFSIANGILSIKTGEMKGPMFSGALTGAIRLKKKFDRSLLNLTARMRPGKLLEKNQALGRFLEKIRSGKGPVVVKIEGTFDRPSISWGKPR